MKLIKKGQLGLTFGDEDSLLQGYNIPILQFNKAKSYLPEVIDWTSKWYLEREPIFKERQLNALKKYGESRVKSMSDQFMKDGMSKEESDKIAKEIVYTPYDRFSNIPISLFLKKIKNNFIPRVNMAGLQGNTKLDTDSGFPEIDFYGNMFYDADGNDDTKNVEKEELKHGSHGKYQLSELVRSYFGDRLPDDDSKPSIITNDDGSNNLYMGNPEELTTKMKVFQQNLHDKLNLPYNHVWTPEEIENIALPELLKDPKLGKSYKNLNKNDLMFLFNDLVYNGNKSDTSYAKHGIKLVKRNGNC